MKKYDKVHIEISNICNLQCSFCPEVVRSKQKMDPALFEEIVRQVAPLTDQVALHLMGDPLVHPRLREFVEISHAHQVRLFLVTNGVLLHEAQTELLLHPAFRQVNFSLHSYFDNFPGRDPSVYLERIFAYVDRALSERPDLYVNFRLWNLQDTKGALTDNFEMLKRVSERFNFAIPQTFDLLRKKSHNIRGRLYLHFDTEFTWPSVDLPIQNQSGTCYGLSSHFGILVDGTVVPCCLDKEGNIPLGRIQDQSLAAILAGERAQRLLTGFRQRRLVEDLCQRCSYIERFERKPTSQIGSTSRV